MMILRAASKRLRRLAFSPDSRLLAAVGEAGTVLLWDVLSREVRTTSRLCAWSLSHLSFTPNSRHLFVSGRALSPPGLWRWPVDGGEAVPVRLDGGNFLNSVALSPAGDRLAARRDDVTCHASDGGAALWRARLDGRHWSNPVAFTPDGREVITGAGSQLLFFHADTGQVSRPALTLPTDVSCLAISPDGALVAAGAKVRLPVWRLEPRTELTTHMATTRKHFQACAFHPSGRLLAATGKDGEVVLLDTITWGERARLAWGVGPLLDVAFSPNGELGACCTEKGQVVVWDVDE
jgi:WD40 repeat protein